MNYVWNLPATPGASLIVAFLGGVCLLIKGCHRDRAGKISPQKISGAVMLSAMAYTILLAVIGHFFMDETLSSVIGNRFGDDRVAWIMVFMTAYTCGRYLALFDKDTNSDHIHTE